jgi:CDP-glycerol glycerophosphotransferase (TagB/SpsB family)
LRLISVFIPKDKNLLVFGSWGGRDFSDNSKYFYFYLKKKKIKKRLVIITENKKVLEKLKKEKHEIYMAYSIKGLWSAARAGMIFITHSVQEDINIMSVSGKTKIAQLWHGIQIKNTPKVFENTKNLLLLHLRNLSYEISHVFYPKISFCIASSYINESFFYNLFSLPKDNIAITGYPRNDILRTQIKIPLFNNLKNYKKYLLYAPTHRSFNQRPFYRLEFLKKLDYYLFSKNFLLIIKDHPALNLKGPVLKEYKNIINANSLECDTQEILSFTDILIADYSSMILDFILTGKPIIFYPYDFEIYKKNPGLLFDYFNDLVGPFAKSNDEIISLIENEKEWSNNALYKKKYKLLQDKIYIHKDNKASERLYSYLLKKKYL